MKAGPLIGYFGCMLWLVNIVVNIASSPKAHWIGTLLGIAAVLCLVAGTIITGVQKGRTGLGFGLSFLAVIFGLGFFVMLLVPPKTSNNAD